MAKKRAKEREREKGNRRETISGWRRQKENRWGGGEYKS